MREPSGTRSRHTLLLRIPCPGTAPTGKLERKRAQRGQNGAKVVGAL
jgi:hypothetical protein